MVYILLRCHNGNNLKYAVSKLRLCVFWGTFLPSLCDVSGQKLTILFAVMYAILPREKAILIGNCWQLVNIIRHDVRFTSNRATIALPLKMKYIWFRRFIVYVSSTAGNFMLACFWCFRFCPLFNTDTNDFGDISHCWHKIRPFRSRQALVAGIHVCVCTVHHIYLSMTRPTWLSSDVSTQIARFMRPTWGPSGADRTQVGPMLTH